MLGIPKHELRWLKTCLSASKNIIRLESFNFCIDLNFLSYGQIQAYIGCISALLGCETTPSNATGAFMTVGTFLRCF